MDTATTTTLRLLPLPPSPPLPPPPPPPPWLTHTQTPFPFPLNNSAYHLHLPPLHIHTPTSFALTFAQISSSSRFRLYATGGDFQRRRRKRSYRKSKQRRWWSDDYEDDDDEDDEVSVFEEKPRSGTLSQVVDSLWIFKVLKSYGWFSPAILLSTLLATGPKAFLMAFSIPLGVSLVILVFEKLSEWLGGNPRPRRRRKTRSPFSIGYDFLMGEEDDQEDEIQQVKRKWKKDYQSRVSRNRSSVHKWSSGGTGSSSRFGGWDELVIEEEVERAQSSPRKMGRTEKPGGEAPVNRSIENREMPLLLRLLVSVFPFLGSLIVE